MDIVFIITGLLLLKSVHAINVSWVEMTIHRNTVHATDFPNIKLPTNVGCIALCTSTPGCLYVTYTFESSTCTRHSRLYGKQVQPNSRIWRREGRCDVSPFEYNNAIGLCIFLSDIMRNWKDAKTDCESRGGRLLVTDTQTKFHGVQSSFMDPLYFWVGGFPRASDGEWVWLTGELIDSTMWHINQPSGIADGLAFWQYHGVLKLDDGTQETPEQYICELL